jgi:dephospho-CoA kinase
VPLLRVGLLVSGSAIAARTRLLTLGAVRADADEQRSLQERGVVLVDLVAGSPNTSRQHLVIEVVPHEGDRNGAPDPVADVTIAGWADARELVATIDALWRERLVPFEQNLRTSRRAPRRRKPVLVEPDPRWTMDAARSIDRLHAAIGGMALRIDHIGSTSVPGLRAKDLLDIQVTTGDLTDARAAAEAARNAGFVHVEGRWFGEDRFAVHHLEEVAVDADPGRPTNVNCRPVTAPVWREALLFRDWLRSQPTERAAYQQMKRDLPGDDEVDVDRYSEDKMPWIRAGLERAERWAAATDWAP